MKFEPGLFTASTTVITYTYDTIDRLITQTGAGTLATYSYNGLSDRQRQVVNGVTTNFALDLNRGLTQVLAESGSSTTSLYGVGRIGERSTTAWSYHLPDSLGSVRQLASSAGAITLARRFEPYGDVLMTSAGSGASAYGYTGEWQQNSLVYLRARYYASGVGRFISRDTWAGAIQGPLSLNRWAYVEGNPINFVDPTGHYRWQRSSQDAHNLIGDDIAEKFGGPNPLRLEIHLEYQMPISKLLIDVIHMPGAVDLSSTFLLPGPPQDSADGFIYDIKPVPYYLAGVQQLQGYLSTIVQESPYLQTAYAPAARQYRVYDWRGVRWSIGREPIPNIPQLLSTGDGEIIAYWYGGQGVILYARTNRPEHLLGVPERVIDQLRMNQQEDSKEVQQFTEMVRQAMERQRQEQQQALENASTGAFVLLCAIAAKVAEYYLCRNQCAIGGPLPAR